MITNNLTVVVINDFCSINGGAAKVAVDTAIGLSKLSVNVHLFCSSGDIDKTLKEAPIRSIIHLNQEEIIKSDNRIKSLFRGLWNMKAYKEMNSLLEKLDKENTVIHVHGWTKSLSISPIYAVLKRKFNVVITLHDFFIYCPNGGFYNFPQKKICHKTPLGLGCIFSNCDSRSYSFKLYRLVRSFLQSFIFSIYKKNVNLISLSGLSKDVLMPYIKNFKSIYYVENPIDTVKIPRVMVKNNNSCVFIGRLSAEKGVEYFCDALNLLDYKNGIIVGEGTNKADLEYNYPNFSFVGWQNKDQIKNILKNARMLVFPSVWYETYGLVVQEALSYGIPCIVADCTAAAELIKHGVNGFIFKSKDVNELAGFIKCLLENDRYANQLGESAYENFWKADHSIDYYSNFVFDIYSKILKNRVTNTKIIT